MDSREGTLPAAAQRHYQLVETALRYLAEHYREQPSLKVLAESAGLSEFHFQRVFSEWAGISPKRYLQLLTLEHAQQLLAADASVLDASLDSGLSGASRLHDLFVRLEAMTPGEFKHHGRDLTFNYGWHMTDFGEMLLIATERGITSLEFVESETPKTVALERHQRAWSRAKFQHNTKLTAELLSGLMPTRLRPTESDSGVTANRDHVTLRVRGTAFQLKVWQALMQIDRGAVSTYQRIAKSIGHPNAARAVGNAIGANPIACLIPCHRVIREGGIPGGYCWGEARKLALLGSEWQ